jgi:SAM-dependent methyltransferase
VSQADGSRIIKIDPWLETPPGRYLLAWEQMHLDRVVTDIFGFHALQLGWPAVEGLRANRMPHRWLLTDDNHATQGVGPAVRAVQPASELQGAPIHATVRADFDALPFPANSLDLVVLPHTLELARDAHHTLREVERVLMPEGKVVVLGFNPMSLWGLRHRFGGAFLPAEAELLSRRRLRDWLRLLGFEVEGGRFGCYRPALRSERWLERFAWMDRYGDRWWPVLGGLYCLVAAKRVRGMRLVGRIKTKRVSAVAAPAVVRHQLKHTLEGSLPSREAHEP